MKLFVITLLLLVSCAVSPKPNPVPPTPIPVPIPAPPVPVIVDTASLQYKCDSAIANNIPYVFVTHDYHLTKPLILQKVVNGMWQFFTIKLIGIASAKSSPDVYLTHIYCDFNDGFGIGVQFGRDIEITNIALVGQYQPPPVNIYNIGILHYAEWENGTAHDSRYAPYAGIAIDPFCDSNTIAGSDSYANLRSYYLPNTGRGGTSGVRITGCRINNFVTGIVVSPNGYTQNAEDIDITDDNIYACKVNIAVCQDQSKDVVIDRLKCWGPTYTVLDGQNYGAGSGGGSVSCTNWNVAGCVNQLFYVNTSRFSLSANFLYAESLFRIGVVGGFAGCNFVNCQFDLLSVKGSPAPDYILIGVADFYGGAIRYYDGDGFHRLNFTTTGFYRHGIKFRDCSMTNYPLVMGLYGLPTNSWVQPTFDNAINYYSGSDVNSGDTTFDIGAVNNPVIDRSNFTGSISWQGLGARAKIGDYLIGEPTGNTAIFYDLPGVICPTRQIGQVTQIIGDTLYFTNVGLNVYSNSAWGRIYLSRFR